LQSALPIANSTRVLAGMTRNHQENTVLLKSQLIFPGTEKLTTDIIGGANSPQGSPDLKQGNGDI
jgi:hypothetical protein